MLKNLKNKKKHEFYVYEVSKTLKGVFLDVSVNASEIDFKVRNNTATPWVLKTNTNKLIRDNSGNIYGVTWNKETGNIEAYVSGKGCALTNNNTEFLANPMSDCSLSIPIDIPGFTPSVSDSPVTLEFGKLIFNLNAVSEYEASKQGQ